MDTLLGLWTHGNLKWTRKTLGKSDDTEWYPVLSGNISTTDYIQLGSLWHWLRIQIKLQQYLAILSDTHLISQSKISGSFSLFYLQHRFCLNAMIIPQPSRNKNHPMSQPLLYSCEISRFNAPIVHAVKPHQQVWLHTFFVSFQSSHSFVHLDTLHTAGTGNSWR